MSYTGLSPEQIEIMLKFSGVKTIDDLFRDIPAEIQTHCITGLPEPLSEIEIERMMAATGESSRLFSKNFAGAGSYNHYIPPVVDEIAGRSEFYTSYTPYQPEVSQGTLAVIFEFQTMISALTSMDVTNASMYDGATSMAEAAMMGVRTNGRSRVLVSRGVHPHYREVLRTYGWAAGFEVVEIPLAEGVTDLTGIKSYLDDNTSSLIIQSPNFPGFIEDIQSIKEKTGDSGTLLIAAVVEGISMGILKGPGELGADIVCGEVQSFGNPLNFGGPYAGYISARKDFTRRMPGRLVGQTLDSEGNRAFTLTLQTREQHIRREKATSNICTNEGLVALRAAVYLSLIGVKLKDIALINHQTAAYLREGIAASGIDIINIEKPFFNEFLIKPRDCEKFFNVFRGKGINPGVDAGNYYDEYKGCILICATETISKNDADEFCSIIREEGL